MKFVIFLLLFLFTSCSSNKSVYWCGDHACINKKEKEAYFMKTMIIEVRDLNKNDKKENSELKLIKQKAISNEKKRIKNERQKAKTDKLEKEKKIKQAKEIAKQAKLEEKIRIKAEKKIAKQIEQDQKKLKKQKNKHQEKILKKEKDLSMDNAIENSEIASIDIEKNNFDLIVNKIITKNKSRPYPNINDIPE